MTKNHGLWAGVLVVGLVIGVVSTRSSGPSSPSPRVLAQSGIIIHPLRASGLAINSTTAEQRARANFPKKSGSPRMSAELVTFSNRHVIRLRNPQPAWIVTWDATAYPTGNGSGRAYHHMNVVVSAKTGATLEVFPSP